MTTMFSQRTVAVATIVAMMFSVLPLNSIEFASAVAEETHIEITDVNGEDPTGDFSCDANPLSNPVSIEGEATADAPPGQLNQYHVQIDWGDGSSDDETEASSFGTGQGTSTRSFSGEHTFTTSGLKTITARLYHQQPPGNDGQADDSFAIEVCVQVEPSETATLTLEKEVVNDDDGEAVDTDWTLKADGPDTISGAEGDAEITGAEVAVGAYELSEFDGPDGYTAGDWICDGGALDGSQLTLEEDDVVTCVITNDDESVDPPAPQCSDDSDNDEDQLIDENDPGCHTDGDAGNSESYDPNDDDETDIPDDNDQCVEGEQWADEVIGADQGKKKGGADVDANRSDPANALGEPDNSFFSLGVDGTLTVKFNAFILDEDGDDVSVHETTNGTYPLETAKVEVSQNGSDWQEVGTATNAGSGDSFFDISGTGWGWIQYVRLTDTSDESLHDNNHDGFDVDAVDGVNGVCEEPQTGLFNLFGFKWNDRNLNGLWDQNEVGIKGWPIFIHPINDDPLETLVINADDPDGELTSNVLKPAKWYLFEVEGTWSYNAQGHDADAEHYSEDSWSSHGDFADDNPSYDERMLDLVINDEDQIWGSYNNEHLYKLVRKGTGGQAVLRIFDQDHETLIPSWYADNAGALTVRIYEVTDQMVTTDLDGKYTAELDEGEYQIIEGMRNDKRNLWRQTYPTNPSYYHVDTEDLSEEGYDFGNYRAVFLKPVKFSDDNQDGKRNAGESHLPGWVMNLYDEGWNLLKTATTNLNGVASFTIIEPGVYNVCEELQEGWTQTTPTNSTNGAVANGSDNSIEAANCHQLNIQIFSHSVKRLFGNHSEQGSGEPCIEGEQWVDEVITENQGQRNNGTDVPAVRSDAESALDEAEGTNADGTFYSLGFEGSLTVKFDEYILDEDGADISIHEATNNRDDYPAETATVEVSQDGSTWFELTEEASNKAAGGVTLLDISESGFDWVQYVRITDTTDSAVHDGVADGFDVDAVDGVHGICDEPNGNGDGGGDNGDDGEENTAELCEDGLDNDGDEFIDENDPDCEEFADGNNGEQTSSNGGGGGGGGGGANLSASCSAIPSSTVAGALVTFSASANNAANGPIIYGWGGAASGNGQSVNAIFNAPGTYIATVFILDSDGEDDTATCTVEVIGATVTPPPAIGPGGGGGGIGGAGGGLGDGGPIAQGPADDGTGTGEDDDLDLSTATTSIDENDGPGFLAGIAGLFSGQSLWIIIIIILILLILWWLFWRRKDDDEKGTVSPR